MVRRIATAMAAFALLECNGVGIVDAGERPAGEIMDVVRNCFGKAGIKPSSAADKSMQLTVGQRKAVDKCLRAAGIEIPDGRS